MPNLKFFKDHFFAQYYIFVGVTEKNSTKSFDPYLRRGIGDYLRDRYFEYMGRGGGGRPILDALRRLLWGSAGFGPWTDPVGSGIRLSPTCCPVRRGQSILCYADNTLVLVDEDYGRTAIRGGRCGPRRRDDPQT